MTICHKMKVVIYGICYGITLYEIEVQYENFEIRRDK